MKYDNEAIGMHTDRLVHGFWTWYRYSKLSNYFVMYIEQPEPNLILGYLVARHPSYVRFSSNISDAKVYVGEKAYVHLREPLPTFVPTENKQVIVIQNTATECCIVCQTVSFYDAEFPIDIFHKSTR